MRALAVVLVAALITGCGANSYQIPRAELARLAATPPEQRGEHVRVIQDIVRSDLPPAAPVDTGTQIVVVPHVEVSVGARPRHHGGWRGVGGKLDGGKASDGKAAAVAFLALAATAMVTAAVIEGTRFDGYAQLHPMHPVHLLGHDGNYTVIPLAWIDPGAAAWTDTAVVRRTEGPWRELERAPLSRRGLAYHMFGGTGSLRSIDGSVDRGPAWTVQLGGFVTQEVGILASVFFGWRTNQYEATLFETRTTVELQYLPIQAGILHAGVYGGLGIAHRFEDAVVLADDRVVAGEHTGGAMAGGALFQLDINTRLALTGRLGLSYAHGEQMHDILVGLSVY